VRCIAIAAAAVLGAGQAAAQNMPEGFVYLRDVAPAIAQDMRYGTADNFVGRPLPGYDAPECILRRDVALALKRVQETLSGLSLKVYDCYRPARATRAMMQWAHDGRPAGASKRFFPKLQKHALFALGYISSRSRHSTGTAVDLTLIPAGSAPGATYDAAASYGACTGPAAERSPDNSVDMGTGYDCFDSLSHTLSGGIGAEQRRWRHVLLSAMAARGFQNYYREWWHFSYAAPGPMSQHDFPIRSRTAMQ
jgi:zinc D-Ala-D-Ala dipeptidase